MEKMIVLGILILFIGICFTPNISGDIQKNNGIKGRDIIYVNWDGSGDYTTIQEGINAANPGDTIYVYNGTYYENVIVDKTIDLIGEDKNNTIIDGGSNDNVIFISINRVNISQFTIQNGGDYDYGIWCKRSYNTITNCTFDNNNCGVMLGSQYQLESEKNKISDCIFSNNMFAIQLFQTANATVTDNILFGCGIVLEAYYLSEWNTHIIENNIVDGKPIRYYKNAENITISSDTAQVILANCTNFIVQNLESDMLFPIELGHSSYNNISHNNFTDQLVAVYMICSDYNNIYQNIFTNGEFGLHLVFSHNNSIFENSIRDNEEGIYVYGSNNRIYHNNFINNTQNAYDEGNNIWDSGYPLGGNYFDDYTGEDHCNGPNQDIPGSDGIGDSPYNISEGDNQDLYPFIIPDGWLHPQIPGDTNGDGIVNVEDLLIVLAQWGTSGPEGDVNSDGLVNVSDLLIILANWG